MNIPRWNKGRDVVDDLLQKRKLQHVPSDRGHADLLIASAHRYLGSAGATIDDDPEAAAALLCDAAGKALAAVLANQGLRATEDGGHTVLYDAVSAQLDSPLAGTLRPFERLRQQRNRAEYPRAERPAPDLDPQDLRADIATARSIVETSERILDQMPVY